MPKPQPSVVQSTPAAFIDVQPAKGRPMLTWVGKRTLDRVPVLPAQCVETFEPIGYLPSTTPLSEHTRCTNALYQGDNKEILAHLLANGLRGQVRLIYIDPPFDSGADYVRQVRLRGDSAKRIAAEDYTVGEQVQYTDIWANDNYLQFIYERLPLMRELLAPNGTIWLHCDHRKVHHLRMLLEEIFGPENYLNTIAWRSQVARGAKVNAFYFPFSTHSIEIFAKDRTAPPIWHAPKKIVRFTEKEAAKHYMHDEQGFFRTSDPGSYSFARLVALHDVGRLYAPYGGEIIIDRANERIYGSNGGNIAIKYYLTAEPDGTYSTEQAIDNLWDDIPGLGTTPAEEVGYPTQKTEALLERIIRVATDPGDLVLDCFMGSGTTLAVAQKLNRRWIGCDINRGSIQTVSRRLQRVISAQLAESSNAVTSDEAVAPMDVSAGEPHGDFTEDATEDMSTLHAATFAVYRINGYDPLLEDQYTSLGGESTQAAIAQLATEAVGVRRMRNDPFFEGMLGERLVKFADFNRPLLVADLEAIVAELATRADDLRDVVVICLGREVATEEWVRDWNHHRGERLKKGMNQVDEPQAMGSLQPSERFTSRLSSRLNNRLNSGLNHLEVIELQSDPRYGHFFIHEPAQATLSILPISTSPHKSVAGIAVQINEFISPTIVHRLHQQSHVEPILIDDWRTMVDSIAIDPAYDGITFRAVIADAPHKRSDLVVGTYQLPNISLPTTVAVKITDMLGEELLITQRVDI